MHGPALVSWLLAALAAGSGGYCGWRVRRWSTEPACGGHHRARRESDVLEAAMGLGMAGMALLPGVFWGWPYALLAAVLLVGALAGRGAGLRVHRLHHGIGALAMAYMALAMAGGSAGGHSGHAGHHGQPGGLPLLTGVLLVYFGAYALWEGSRVLAAGGPVAAAPLPRACRAAMGIGMFAMLLSM
ncbi:DUF5134 domain-containing protein [Kitasatospora cineracea]|uniref:Uncharacterized protein DUF5134 n=1 Tax=Kitasatospora cineracea TaxID=88074 RepID=A0A3N4RRW5_9ACTN|nr:DUF5134 domain-containing protein [Kitasatospora cineracea]ROR45254.1 uncharacterized protein DUF5134 [Kitasatospora cineracea]RPE35606.1 uncharacterized protein DUF5134 [Kitasatospora cineracea]